MKIKLNHVFAGLALAALSTLDSHFSSAYAQGTAFTYQGHLETGTNGVNGNYDFTFELYNAATGGSQVGSTVTNLDVGVTNGLFTVTTDFGAVYNGTEYWLQIGVRSNGTSTFDTLTPRQELTPVPYSVTAENVLGDIPLAQLPAGVVTNDASGVTLTNLTVGGTLDLSQSVIYADGNPLLHSDTNLNFFAGPLAGNLTLTGEYNTGVGGDALANVTAGSYNSAFGLGAMVFTTSGSNNTATGEYALSTQGPGYLTGNYNTADGAIALDNDNSGNYNTGIGYATLYETQSGSDNIALGASAGYNITGNSNIDIGSPGLSSDNMVMRLGSGQTETYIAGVINGNGAGLTNLNLVDVLQSDFGNDNFFAGLGAGSPTVSGTDNVGLGGGALGNIENGNYNTASGVGSLGQNTNGSYNSAFGVDALAFHVSGDNNTAVGADALGFSGSGGYDTAIGADAMALSGGSENTATGYYALEYNVSGANYNSAYGYYSMGGGGGATSASANSGFGGYSLYSITSGYNNTAAGYQALDQNETGHDNVSVGVATLTSIVAGNSLNTAVGTYSLDYMTNGQENIALGYAAGYDLINGSDNIFIGNYGEADDNNVIRIGNGQSATYLDGGVLAFDGGDTNNGLVNAGGGSLTGISPGEGAFLYGYNGGWLGAVGPTTVCLSWNYTGDVWVSNNFSTATLTIRGGSDLAEPFKITPSKDEDAQGSVMVIDEEHPGQLKVSTQAYDTHVAGVLSGANGVNPGIQMQQEGVLEGGKNVALTGRVYVQADASNGAIRPGDLLTTSSEPGRAMKVTDHVRAQGAILGKAMTGLSEGKGMVLVLVTLQ